MDPIRLISQKSALVVVAIFSAAMLSSCTNFRKVWADEMAKPAQKRGDLTGPWEGTWRSDVNGHNGKLRCIITKQADGAHEFHYWAQWQKVLSGSFRQNYEVTENKGKRGTFHFEGERDLGKLGGTFTHKGTATAKTLKATYASEMGDHGVFELSRPQARPGAGTQGK